MMNHPESTNVYTASLKTLHRVTLLVHTPPCQTQLITRASNLKTAEVGSETSNLTRNVNHRPSLSSVRPPEA